MKKISFTFFAFCILVFYPVFPGFTESVVTETESAVKGKAINKFNDYTSNIIQRVSNSLKKNDRIKYLDIDNTLPDNYLPTILSLFPKIDKKLDKINKTYYYTVNTMVIMVIINFIVSLDFGGFLKYINTSIIIQKKSNILHPVIKA